MILLAAVALVVTGAKVFPAPEAAPLLNTTVLIQDGKIAAVGANIEIPKDAVQLACDDCFIFAGFWNAHIHFTEPKWAKAATAPAATLAHDIADMLTSSGFSTVVDLASDLRTTSALRRRINSGEIAGPRIFTAGSAIYPPNGVPYYLDNLPAQIRAILPQPSTAAEAAAIEQRNIAAGANVLKLFTGSYISRTQINPMPLDVAQAAVSVAHAHHQLAFAHPSNLEGVRIAMDAGVDVLAHAPDTVAGVDDALLQLLIAHHMSMIPTLKLFSGESDIANIRDIVAKFHQFGGHLIFGTDTGFLTDYDLHEEYRQLAVTGLSFKDVLAMLTTGPVELFGLKNEGRVAPGNRGDLTILTADPSVRGLTAFTEVRYVIREGKVIFDASKFTR